MVQNVQRWVGKQMFIMESGVMGRPPEMSDFVHSVDQKNGERWSFTI
jgi:hypothetical protein